MRRLTRPSASALALTCLAAIALGSGCAEWPRFAHVPGPPADEMVPSDADPQVLVSRSIDWTAVTEAEPNDSPVSQPVAELDVGEGLDIGGVLEGSGWDGQIDPGVIEGEGGACEGVTGTYSPVDDSGDYSEDIEFYLVEPVATGALCGRFLLDQGGHGVDMLLLRLDDCQVPEDHELDGAGDPVGYNMGGTSGSWAHPVDAGTAYAVLLASFSPPGQDDIGYSLGLSMVSMPTDGSDALCPLLPQEVSP